MSDHAASWMPLYIGDYLRDTSRLTTEGHGAYLLLIFDYWVHGKPLPDDDMQLAAVTKLAPARWQALRPTLSQFFQIGDGLWHHRRIDIELEKIANRYQARSNAGSKGAANRWQTHGNANGKQDDKPIARARGDPNNHNHLSPPSVPLKGDIFPPASQGGRRRQKNGPATTIYEGANRAAEAYIRRNQPDLSPDQPPPDPLLDRR